MQVAVIVKGMPGRQLMVAFSAGREALPTAEQELPVTAVPAIAADIGPQCALRMHHISSAGGIPTGERMPLRERDDTSDAGGRVP